MKVDNLILGAYETNCYVIRGSESNKDCMLIDTGLEADSLIDFLKDNDLNPIALVLTHGHADHITGLGLLRKHYPAVKVFIHKEDGKMLTEAEHNLSALTGILFSTAPADFFVEDGDTIDQAGIKLQVLHTPGHTQGGICLYNENDGIVFTGDTLFADSVGRTDFPGGSFKKLSNSIKQKLCPLPDETIVYPGHGPATTLAREKAYNQYLR